MVELLCGPVIINSMSNLKRYTGTCAVLVMVSVILLGESLAWGRARVHRAPVLEQSLPWMAIVYSLIALAGICVAAFKNPRRTQPR